MSGFMHFIAKLEKTESEIYAQAGSISDQSFEFIRGIKSLNGQNHESEKYNRELLKVKALNKKHGWKGSIFYGMFESSWTIIFALSFLIGNYALGKSWHNHNTGRCHSYHCCRVVLVIDHDRYNTVVLARPDGHAFDTNKTVHRVLPTLLDIDNSNSVLLLL